MLIKEEAFIWLRKYLPQIKSDGPKNSSGKLSLSAESSMGFQNGVLFFELFQRLVQETQNKNAEQQLSKIKIMKSQARIAIISNMNNLTPLFRCFNVSFDENKRDRIANSGLFYFLIFILFLLCGILFILI